MGSGEAGNIPYYREAAWYARDKEVPLYWSNGCMTAHQINDTAIMLDNSVNCINLELECVTEYPSKIGDVNWHVIKQDNLGYSDHCAGHSASVLAAGLGAPVIEKHITCASDVNMPGTQDQHGSVNEYTIGAFVDEVRAAYDGAHLEMDGNKRVAEWAVKSLCASCNIPKDSVLSEALLIPLRPGGGIPYQDIGSVIGKKICRDIKKGEQIKKDDIE